VTAAIRAIADIGIGARPKLSHATQSVRHSNLDRGRDLYETPACATEALLRVEQLPLRIWEPAAGRGAIVDMLRRRGHTVVASDVVDYGELDFVADFLTTVLPPAGCRTIITNPPYRIAADFVRHALDLVPDVHLLLRLAFLESIGRTDILEKRGLRVVRVFRRRLPMMDRDGWSGPRASSAIPFAWFSWSRDHCGPATILVESRGSRRHERRTSPTNAT